MLVLSLICMCHVYANSYFFILWLKDDSLSLYCGALFGTFGLILQFHLATKSYLFSGVSIEHWIESDQKLVASIGSKVFKLVCCSPCRIFFFQHQILKLLMFVTFSDYSLYPNIRMIEPDIVKTMCSDLISSGTHIASLYSLAFANCMK